MASSGCKLIRLGTMTSSGHDLLTGYDQGFEQAEFSNHQTARSIDEWSVNAKCDLIKMYMTSSGPELLITDPNKVIIVYLTVPVYLYISATSIFASSHEYSD